MLAQTVMNFLRKPGNETPKTASDLSVSASLLSLADGTAGRAEAQGKLQPRDSKKTHSGTAAQLSMFQLSISHEPTMSNLRLTLD